MQLPFKSIYTHQDGYEVDILHIDTEMFPGFLVAAEVVILDEDTTSQVTSVYDMEGMFITGDVDLMQDLLTIGARDFEGVMCPKLAVIAKYGNARGYVTWSNGLKNFDIGFKPCVDDLSTYLPESVSSASFIYQKFITEYTGDKNYVVKPIKYEGSIKYCAFHIDDINTPAFVLCDMPPVLGVAKYHAESSEDCRLWAIESTHCQVPDPINLKG